MEKLDKETLSALIVTHTVLSSKRCILMKRDVLVPFKDLKIFILFRYVIVAESVINLIHKMRITRSL